MDRVHERLAAFEQTDPNELRKTDSELPAIGVMLLGSTSHDPSESSSTTGTLNERSLALLRTRTTKDAFASSISGQRSNTWSHRSGERGNPRDPSTGTSIVRGITATESSLIAGQRRD